MSFKEVLKTLSRLHCGLRQVRILNWAPLSKQETVWRCLCFLSEPPYEIDLDLFREAFLCPSAHGQRPPKKSCNGHTSK